MYERSSCCGKPVRIEPEDELHDPNGKTFYAVCTGCGDSCNIQ